MDEILRLFPQEMKEPIANFLQGRWPQLQEIRVRLYKPVECIFDDKIEWIPYLKPTERDCQFLLNQMSKFSLYRMEDELREGFITIEGGHRVGLAGKVNTTSGLVHAIKHITFFNIRIAKQLIGAARHIIPYMTFGDSYLNTLIVGPPQTGKTTIIRDLVRMIATGWTNHDPKKVGIVDERSEIAGSIQGFPQHDIGLRTDVMDACPKAEGMMMLIRSMSPEIIVVDEIGHQKDVDALMEAVHAGVQVICTIHGKSLDELKKRPSLQPIFKHQVFNRIVFLNRSKKPGSIQHIYDEHGRKIHLKSGGFQHEVDWRASFHQHHNMDRL